jgi:hypothetical protein
MKINPTPVAPGTYEVFLDDEHLSVLSQFETLPKEFFENYCAYLAEELGLNYKMHQVYDYRYVIKKGRISDGSHTWHNDKDINMDCILMIYVVDPKLNEQTGMRVGFRNTEIENSEKFMDLWTGRAFLTHQGDIKFQHKVENVRGNVNYRSCISLNLFGFDNIVENYKLEK